MTKPKAGAGHKHDWQQARVALEQKGGRVAAVAVTWVCAGRKCPAEILTRCAIRKPAPKAKSAPADDWPESRTAAYAREFAERRRQTGAGSLAAQEKEHDLDDWEFEPAAAGGNGPRSAPVTAEDLRNWQNFLAQQ